MVRVAIGCCSELRPLRAMGLLRGRPLPGVPWSGATLGWCCAQETEPRCVGAPSSVNPASKVRAPHTSLAKVSTLGSAPRVEIHSLANWVDLGVHGAAADRLACLRPTSTLG
jgi:hypothetical protein